jgi:ABC-2 type transport system ATP-binding protein
LAFSIAIHSDADVYLIDEIISVGDAEFQNKCIAKIHELKSRGKTLVIISHSLDLLNQLTNRIIFLEKGHVVTHA